MKKILLLAVVFGFIATSCNDDDSQPQPQPGSTTEVLQGNITGTMTLDASKKYLLTGKVYIQSGAKLIIPAGTVIMGDKETAGALIVNRGGQLFAEGTAAKPVIFTSEAPAGFRNRGDWGGIVICGNSTTNGNASSTIEGISGDATTDNGKYGPGDGGVPQMTQNSGKLSYVRIEFAGIPLSPDNELNSLTMGSVGSGTEIDHIMVSYAGDDAIEWFGGTNNLNYLVTYHTLDDDFDTDRGYTGKVQYGLVVRDKATADISTSRAWESSSNSSAAANPHSAPSFANVTVLGPRMFAPKNGDEINLTYGAALEINSNSNIKVYNSIITGFPQGVRYSSAGAEAIVEGNVFTFNKVTAGSSLPAGFINNDTTAAVETIFGAKGSPVPYTMAAMPVLQIAGSPKAAGAPDLTAKGFEKQDFFGAFGTSAVAGWNWSSGWINFDPINTVY